MTEKKILKAIQYMIIYIFTMELAKCRKGTGPIFIMEPPNEVDFLNTKGVVINCIVHGDPEPTISWKIRGNDIINSHFVKILRNNSISLMPFDVTEYDQEIHASSYTCVAENRFGLITSRNVHVNAVVKQEYNTQVYDEYVMEGNTAVLRCRIPSYIKDYVHTIAWLKDEVEISSMGERYQLGYNGNLYLLRSKLSDSNHMYKCKTIHKVTRVTKISESGGKLHIKIPTSGMPPTIAETTAVIKARLGDIIKLPCIAHGSPPPQYRWCFKKKQIDECYSADSTDDILTLQLKEDDSGIYICTAFNELSSATSTIKVSVNVPLNVFIHPQIQRKDVGENAVLKCVVSGGPITEIKWLRNGKVIKEEIKIDGEKSFVYEIDSVDDSSQGMYQCFVSNEFDVKQASGQIILSAFPPKIIDSFETIVKKPGASVSFQCSASGEPVPEFRWYTRSKFLNESQRIRIQNENINGKFVSSLKIKNLLTIDGGLYTCEASNKIGKVKHSAFLNINGLPKVWPLGNVSSISSDSTSIQCHFSGYPIKTIEWFKDDVKIAENDRIVQFINGSLRIENVDKKSDAGKYKCVATNDQGFQSSGEGFLNVLEPPKLIKFNQKRIIGDGGRFQLLCQAHRGDPPIQFKWRYNGKEIPHELKLITTDSVYSSSLTSTNFNKGHSGNYSCLAKNDAGVALTSTVLFVKGSPEWIQRPHSSAIAIGNDLSLMCSGESFPKPTSTWKINTGDGSETLKIKNKQRFKVLSNGTLQINNIQKKDLKKQFICTVSNGIKPDLTAKVRLTLRKAQIIFTRFSNSILAKIHSVSVLKCKASGVGPFIVQWKNGSTTLRNDDRIKIEVLASENTVESSLILKNIRQSDTGLYSCKVISNKLSNSTSIYLQVEGYEDIVPALGGSDINWDSPLDENRFHENGTKNDFQILNQSLLYIIPTTTAAVVLFVILVIVCFLLIGQRKRNRNAKMNFDTSRHSTLNRKRRQCEEQYNVPKTSNGYYDATLHDTINTNEHLYSSMSTYPRNSGGSIQPYATFTSKEIRKNSEPATGSAQYELQRFQ